MGAARKLLIPSLDVERPRLFVPGRQWTREAKRPLRIWEEPWQWPYCVIAESGTFSTNHAHLVVDGTVTTITKPSGISAGDILICEFGVNRSVTASSIAAPSGWTQIGATISSTKVKVGLWWALQSTSNLGFTLNSDGSGSSADLSWVCVAYSGVDNTTPVDAAGTGNSNTGANSISVTGFNTATNNAVEVVAIANWNGSGDFSATSWTARNSDNTNCQSGILYGSAITPAGATGAKTVSDSAAASGNILCYQQFALRPAAAASTFAPRVWITNPNLQLHDDW